jgi:hypothetical protein
MMNNNYKENEDYYLEKGRVIFTKNYLLKRKSCCGNKNNCRHCPYTKPVIKGNTALEK